MIEIIVRKVLNFSLIFMVIGIFVFLGNMGNVSSSGGSGKYWDFNGKIYFCNPADKSLSDVNMGTFKDKAVFCFGEGNTTHLANPFATITTDECLVIPSESTPSKLFALTRLSSFSTQMLDVNSLAFCIKNVAGRACNPT